MNDKSETIALTDMSNSHGVAQNKKGEHNDYNTNTFRWSITNVTQSPLFVSLACLISTCLWCLSIVSAQMLDGSIPDFQLNALRFITQICVVLPILLCQRGDFKVQKSHQACVLLVNVLIFASNFFYNGGLVYLPVGTYSGLTACVAITCNALLSVCAKNERTLPLYIAAFIAVIGIVLMAQPPFLFKYAHLPSSPVVNWTSPCSQVALNMDVNRTFYKVHNTSHLGINQNPSEHQSWIGYIFILMAGCIECLYFTTSGQAVQHVKPLTVIGGRE
jgi:drug/metabolite transporter (DMT)-like permease